MTEVTVSPRRVCRAIVPPHPSTSSSGCVPITRTRLLIAPSLSGPIEVAQCAPPQHRAVLSLQLEQHDRALRARDELPTGLVHRAQHWSEDGTRWGVRPELRRPRGLPHPPARSLDRAEGAGIR